MDSSPSRLWPFGIRAALLWAPVLLVGLLISLAILRKIVAWPGELDKVVLTGIVVLSLIPLLLAVIDNLAERRATLEFRGLRLDFSRVAVPSPTSVSVPQNIGAPGRPLTDSDTSQILDVLRAAVTTDVVVVDLEDGHAWWETRLLVLVSGAARLGKPRAIVFLATEAGLARRFAGWAEPAGLLPLLLKADVRYQESHARAHAAARQWELVEPLPLADPPQAHGIAPRGVPPTTSWMQGLAVKHSWMAFDMQSGLPNELAAEQFLASELGETVEMAGGSHVISVVRLQELFRPIVRTSSTEETAPASQHLRTLMTQGDDPYLAVTRDGVYLRLVPRLAALSAVIVGMVEQVGGSRKDGST